jgi:hypothetical protein
LVRRTVSRSVPFQLPRRWLRPVSSADVRVAGGGAVLVEAVGPHIGGQAGDRGAAIAAWATQEL